MIMWGEFDSSSSQYQFTVEYNQLSYLHMHMGVDGLSLYFVLLTTFTMPICILASWENVKHNIKSYMIAFLVLESLLIAVFVVLDLLLFYHVGSTDFEVLSLADISFESQRWLWLAIFLSLAIKTQLLPVHIWL